VRTIGSLVSASPELADLCLQLPLVPALGPLLVSPVKYIPPASCVAWSADAGAVP
jgi:hypothetical protein